VADCVIEVQVVCFVTMTLMMVVHVVVCDTVRRVLHCRLSVTIAVGVVISVCVVAAHVAVVV